MEIHTSAITLGVFFQTVVLDVNLLKNLWLFTEHYSHKQNVAKRLYYNNT